MSSKETVRLFPLGGIGRVTKNLFVYEYRIDGEIQDIIVIDCGIGFPDETMYGVDFVIPDISYLMDKKSKIRGIFLTHGHDDHIGALPYVLPELSVPVYGTPLTAALVESKLQENSVSVTVNVVSPKDQIRAGAFTLKFIHITHSIPDATNILITTPIGKLYHGSDFKFDFTPLDNKPSDLGSIARSGEEGVLCLLSDCLGSERSGYTLSEQVIGESIEAAIAKCRGKFIFTTVSSNILRIGKVIEIAKKYKRRVGFIGRSIERNMEIAQKMGYVSFSKDQIVYDKQLSRIPDQALCLIVAGSQGQTDSALSRIGSNEHKYVKIKENDQVFFSADPIPGNESAVHTLIDALTAQGAEVSYSDVVDDVHVSGHGSQQDLRLMLALTKPRYILPIGGTYRHMIHYKKLASEMGFDASRVLIPQEGDILEFSSDEKPRVAQKIETEQIMVDGFGIGDVGEVVLRDRQMLASEGIVVVVVPIDEQSGKVLGDPDIISRGFIYMKESKGLVNQAKQVVRQSVDQRKGRVIDWQFVRRDIEHKVGKFLLKETGRKPLIVAVVLEV